jgi:hypothetical protein
MNIEEIVKHWNNDDGVLDNEQVDYCVKNIREKDFHSHVDGKLAYRYTVYEDISTNKLYRACIVESNSGYWSDAEQVDSYCEEVIEKQIVKTIYVTKENV